MQKKFLQLAIIIFGFVPVLAGGYGVINGVNLFDSNTIATSDLNNHVRYLSGLLLGIGILFWSFIPNIETKSTPIQILTLIVFIGGLSRLSGTVIYGEFSPSIAFALTMKLIITPLICAGHWWLFNRNTHTILEK